MQEERKSVCGVCVCDTEGSVQVGIGGGRQGNLAPKVGRAAMKWDGMG